MLKHKIVACCQRITEGLSLRKIIWIMIGALILSLIHI